MWGSGVVGRWYLEGTRKEMEPMGGSSEETKNRGEPGMRWSLEG